MSYANAGRAVWKISRTLGLKNLPENLQQSILDARSRNTTILEGDFTYMEGKKRMLQISYYPPNCTDDGSCADNVCGDAVPSAMEQVQYAITQCTASDVYSLNPNDIRLVDNDWTFSEHARMIMERALVQVRHRMSEQMAALLIGRVGVRPDGSATRLLPWVNTQTGAVQPVGMDLVEQDFYDVGVRDPFIVGGGPVWQWVKSADRGGLSADGLYLDRVRTSNLYYDKLVNQVLNNGAENVLAFDPEMIKFISYNKNAGIFRTRDYTIEDIDSQFAGTTDHRIRGTMPDAFTGLLWDFDSRYDDTANNCDGGWKFQIRLEWDIFFMPPNVCINGYTGIVRYTTCPPIEPECPTGSPITPGEEDTFSASLAGVTYPFTLSSLNVAGFASTPNVTVADHAALVAQLNGGAPAGYNFELNGTSAEYDGYKGTTALINGGVGNPSGYTLTFS